MRKLKIISVICAISFANIASSNPLCSLKDGPGKNAVRINDLPGYFFKVHPDGKYLSYITPGANKIINLETGEQYNSVGNIDPVWSPDGKFLTHPSMTGTMDFHHGDAIIKASVEGKPEQSPIMNANISGVYQSIGKTGDGYRMVTDANGASVSEYNFVENGPIITSEPVKVCGNIPDMPTDLPMLSKDAKYLSVYDQNTKSTKIFNIKDNNCSLALDLGFATGKVSFNNDSSQISFHLDQFAEFDSGYFSGISKDKVKNVVVMKLSSTDNGEKLAPQSWALVSNHTEAGNGGYYPDFDKAGNIYHLEDVNNFFQFVKTSQDDLEWVDFDENSFKDYVGCEDCNKKKISPLEVLAQLWSAVCKDETKVDMSRANVLAMAMNPEKCQEMVADFWTESLGITKEALLLACPKKNSSPKAILGQWDLEREVSTEKLIQSRCTMCHTQPMDLENGKYTYVTSDAPGKYEPASYTGKKHVEPLTDLNKLSAVTIQQIQMSVQDGGMPKGSAFDDNEKEMIRSFLDRKLLDLPGNQPTGTQVIYNYSDEAIEKELESDRREYANQPEILQSQILYKKCYYNKKYCQDYLDYRQPLLEKEAAYQPENERELYIQKQLMSIKCMNAFGATLNECREWEEKHPDSM